MQLYLLFVLFGDVQMGASRDCQPSAVDCADKDGERGLKNEPVIVTIGTHLWNLCTRFQSYYCHF